MERPLPMGVLYDLHVYLVRGWTGVIGSYGIGVTGLILFCSILTGLVLWWPLFERGLGLAIQRGRGTRRFLYGLHSVLGVCALPLLIVVSFTGLPLFLIKLIIAFCTLPIKADAGFHTPTNCRQAKRNRYAYGATTKNCRPSP